VTLASARVLARLARRDIARHRVRSLLVVALVLLPVAAMVAGIALYRTTQPTHERQVVAQMGQADLIAMGTTRAELERLLPAGSRIEGMTITSGRIVLPGARPSVTLRAMDIDGLGAGMLTLVDGASPTGPGQAAISEGVATLAGVRIGGQLTLDGIGAVTVVGLVENPMVLTDRVVVLDPSAVSLGDESQATWLIGLPPGADADAIAEATTSPDANATVTLQSRTSSQLAGAADDSVSPSILILGSLALVEAALIASAAFAVSIRRRQRELGLLAASGATPRQLAATVVLEAGILGLVACVAGVGVGLAGDLVLSPWLDQLTQHRNPPLVVDVIGLLAPMAIGLLAALIAAVRPAWTVARIPVLLALSGRRPASAPARRTLVVGLAAIAVATVMTVAGATMSAAGDNTVRVALLVAGAVLTTLGFGACGPWLLERLDGIATRLPLPARLAYRDTSRGRSRSSPIVTAILASLAAVIAIGAFQASRDAETRQGWLPSVYPDELVVSGAGAESAADVLRHEAGVLRAMAVPGLGMADPTVFVAYELPDAADARGHRINLVDGCTNCSPGGFQPYIVSTVAAATPDLLALAHATSAASDLAAGRAVIVGPRVASASSMEIVVFGDPTASYPTQRVSVPVRAIQAPVLGALPEAFLPDATIRELGLVAGGPGADGGGPFDGNVVVQYDHPVTDVDIAHAKDIAARYPDTFATVDEPPGRQGAEFRLVITALVLLFAVSVTGMAIALGEAESRPEQRSLLAIGADPKLRRRIAAARAAVLALLAGLLAVPAGLLPMWGIFASRGSPFDIPTIEIVGAVVALPILAVASSWLLSRPIPDWSAFRDVGAS
jgi:putative ABC transport system permease protein